METRVDQGQRRADSITGLIEGQTSRAPFQLIPGTGAGLDGGFSGSEIHR